MNKHSNADCNGVQVFRWSALASGVVYGIYRQSTISAADKLRENAAEYHRKESLIHQAKAEFAKKNAPKESQSSGMLGSHVSSASRFLNCWAEEKRRIIWKLRHWERNKTKWRQPVYTIHYKC